MNKGAAIQHMVNQFGYDEVLCAGDDITDESMFDTDDVQRVTIKIGEGETRAKYRFLTTSLFRDFLQELLKEFSCVTV